MTSKYCALLIACAAMQACMTGRAERGLVKGTCVDAYVTARVAQQQDGSLLAARL